MKFSIIIPVYNCERYLKRCINSIINQTYKDFELILINDGSTDKSSEICKWAKNTDQRVIVIEQENQGPGAARNYGIKAATGDFIVFIDSDDYVENSCLTELQEYLNKNDVDILFKGFKFENQKNGEILSEVTLPQGVYDKSQFHSIIKTLIDNDLFGYTWCKVIRSDLFIKFHIMFNTQYSLHEDLIMICQVCEKAETIGILNTTGYHYTKDDNTLCTKFRSDMVDNIEFVNRQVFDFYEHIGIDNIDEMIVQRAVFSVFLILKNFATADSKNDFTAEYKKLLNSKTVEEIRKRSKVYRKVIKGKKKWIIYFICMLRSPMMFKLAVFIYGRNIQMIGASNGK